MVNLTNKASSLKEIVLSQDERSKNAHREIFFFGEDAYVMAGDGILNLLISISESDRDILKLHISAGWENILMVALWKTDRPTIGNVFSLLRNAGIKTEELFRFRNSDINDLFPWLYYGKRFNVLRKICSLAKSHAESQLKDKNIRIECHLVSEDTSRIIASSL